MMRIALITGYLVLCSFAARGATQEPNWTLEAVQSLPETVHVEEAALQLAADRGGISGEREAVWMRVEVHEPGAFVLVLKGDQNRQAQAWAASTTDNPMGRRVFWQPLKHRKPSREIAFTVPDFGSPSVAVLIRLPQSMFSTTPHIEVLRPDHFANVDLAGTVVLAVCIGSLLLIFLMSTYIVLRHNRRNVGGILGMSALIALQFAVRSGGIHLLTMESGSPWEAVASFLAEATIFPLALAAIRLARPETAWNWTRWVAIYFISWGLFTSAAAFSMVPADWAQFGCHMLFFVMGLLLWSQIQSSHAPLHYVFLAMSAVEGVLAVDVLAGSGWSWSPWVGAYLETVLLVWALVREVNGGFMEALKLAAEKHEFETLKHRAYTSGLEEEKKRIAGELHDDVLGSLVLVTHSMPLNNPFRSTLQHVISQTRRLTMNLSPHGVAQMPFSDALERIAKSYRSEELSVWLHVHAAPDELPEKPHFELFRMAQELLQNIYKHANANRVDISLDWDPTEGMLLLTVEDNGIGFDPDAVQKRGAGLGLANLKSRAQAIGALLTIESSPGSGTYISIEWVNK